MSKISNKKERGRMTIQNIYFREFLVELLGIYYSLTLGKYVKQ